MNNIKLMEYLNCKKSKNFNEVLFNYIDQSGHKDSEIYNKVDIDRKLFSKIRCNDNYIPKKNTIIKLMYVLILPHLLYLMHHYFLKLLLFQIFYYLIFLYYK